MRMLLHDHLRWPWCATWVVMALVLASASPAGAGTLSDAFTAASPGSGYDTMLVLQAGSQYTGGLTLPAGNHCIVGNGATVNLQSQSVAAGNGVTLDVSGVSFTNGTMGLDFSGSSMGHVECCNFVNNDDGIRVWEGASVTLVSNNFVGNSHYGVYRHEYGSAYNAYNNAWDNAANDYVYYCPG